MLGGVCSIIVRCIILILAGLEIYTTFNTPRLKETNSFSQIDLPNKDNYYDISIDQGLPAFYVSTRSNDESGSYIYTTNDSDLFEFGFVLNLSANLEDLEAKPQYVDALDCKTVVGKYVTNEYAKEQILKEFDANSDFLCPDLPSFQLYM